MEVVASESEAAHKTDSTKRTLEPQVDEEHQRGTSAGLPLFMSGAAPPPIQARLRINRPGDRYEQEADRVSEAVMRLGHPPEATVQRACSCGGKCADCRSDDDEEQIVQRRERGAAPSAPEAGALLPSGGGQPLDAVTRNDFEGRFGRDFSGVRVHAGPEAARRAQSIRARAFTAGNDIVFDAGEYAPSVESGRYLLAHELAHVVQQGGERRFIQRYPLVSDVTFTLGVQQTGLSYPELRRAITPEQWQQLDNAAQERGLRQQENLGMAGIDAAEREQLSRDATTEIEVPLSALLRPQPSESGGDFASNLYGAMVDRPGNVRGHAAIVQAEMARRWSELNGGLLESNVRVALLDPEGRLGGPPQLIFEVEGQTIPTRDGGLYILPLDQATSANGSLATIQEQMSGELQEIQDTANLGLLAEHLIEQGRSMIDAGHRSFSADEANAWNEAIEEGFQRITQYRTDHERVSSVLQSAQTDLHTFLTSEMRPWFLEHHEFLRENAPPESYGERQVRNTSSCYEDAEELRREGGFWNYLAAGEISRSCNAQAQGYGVATLVTFGYTEQSRQWHEAFRGGHISLNAFEEGLESAGTRALITGSITVILTIATMGLAGPVLGTSASLGSQVLYWGGTAAATSMLSMGASSLYTSSVSLGDPYAQALWEQQGLRTPGEILTHGAISFGVAGGLAAAGPLLGWLSRGGNTEAAQALVAASAEGRALTTLPGVEVREVSRGVVEVSIAGQPGAIRMTQQGFQFMMAAGKGEAAIAEFSWQAASRSPVVQGLSQEIPALAGLQDIAAVSRVGGQPMAVGVTPEGWVVLAPRTSTPIITGLWGRGAASASSGGSLLALPSQTSPFSSLLEAAGPQVSLAGRGTALPPWLSSGGQPGGPLMLPGGGGTGPLIVDVQAGTPYFLNALVASQPGSRGVGIEAGDWMIGYQGAHPMFEGDLNLSRQVVQNYPQWPDTPAHAVTLDELLAQTPPTPAQLDPARHLFPESGSVTILRGSSGQPEPFFPARGGEGRLVPLNQTDVTGLQPTTHPQLHGMADQIFWRRPFALQRADDATQQAMGQELNRMLRRNGFLEFRLLAGGDRNVVYRIADEIPGAEFVEVSRGQIDRFLRDGTLPDDPDKARVLRDAERDLRDEFSPLGRGTFNRIIRIYKRGE